MVGLPCSFVDVLVCLGVFCDILRCFIARWVTGKADVVWILVDPEVIETHVPRQKFLDVVINWSETVCHTQVHDDRQRFHRNHPLADVAVGPEGSTVESPCLILTDIPGDIATGAGCVVEGVNLVLCSIIPVIIEVAEPRHRLLIGPATIGVNLCNLGIVYSCVFCHTVSKA